MVLLLFRCPVRRSSLLCSESVLERALRRRTRDCCSSARRSLDPEPPSIPPLFPCSSARPPAPRRRLSALPILSSPARVPSAGALVSRITSLRNSTLRDRSQTIMDEWVSRSPTQLHLAIATDGDAQARSCRGHSGGGGGNAENRTEAMGQSRKHMQESHPPPHASSRRRHALTDAMELTAAAALASSEQHAATALAAPSSAAQPPRASPKSAAHRSRHALAIDPSSCAVPAGDSSAAKQASGSEPLSSAGSVASASRQHHSRKAEATPAPLASPGPIFDLELTTPVPSPSPPPRKESVMAYPESGSASASGGSNSGISLSDLSRRSMSDVDVSRSRSSISLGWAAQSSTNSDGHEAAVGTQQGPAASPYAVASPDPNGNAASHAAPRSIPQHRSSMIHLPVALKTSLDEHTGNSSLGPPIKFATSDLTAYRSLSRTAGSTGKSAIGMHFHTMQPPTRSQREAQAQQPSSSSFAAQQAIRQQLLSAAAASAESAEGAQAAQWEALQDVMSFPPPPPLPLVHPSQLRDAKATATVYPQSTRAPLRTIAGGSGGTTDSAAHGFYTPNPPASRRVALPVTATATTATADLLSHQYELGGADFEFDFAKPASTTAGRCMLYNDVADGSEKQLAAPAVVPPRHSSEAEKELQHWESRSAQRNALNRRSVRTHKIEAAGGRNAREEDAGLFEMDL